MFFFNIPLTYILLLGPKVIFFQIWYHNPKKVAPHNKLQHNGRFSTSHPIHHRTWFIHGRKYQHGIIDHRFVEGGGRSYNNEESGSTCLIFLLKTQKVLSLRTPNLVDFEPFLNFFFRLKMPTLPNLPSMIYKWSA